MARWVSSLTSLLVGLLLTLLLAEVMVRVADPVPRRTLVRAAVVGGFSEVEGVTVWPDEGPEHPRTLALHGEACSSEAAFRVLIAGDSVLNGVELAPEDTPGLQLRSALRRRFPGQAICVRNLAVPGFETIQALATAERGVAEYAPQAVVLGSIESVAWPARFGDVVLPSCGDPSDPHLGNPLHLPAALHTALITRSHLYAYALAARPECDGYLEPPPWIQARFVALAQALQARGSLLLLVPDRLLDGRSEALRQEEARRAETWRQLVGPHGGVVAPIEDWLPDEVLGPSRIDVVHYSPEGSRRVAEGLAELLAPRVEAWAQRHATPSAP